MNLRPRKASWFVSGLLLVTVVSAGLELVVAQPKSETSRPAIDTSEATFEVIGEHDVVNINHITYTSDAGGVFDIYFACSSTRGEDPLRLTDAKDIAKAKSYFNDEKRYGKHFVKINNYRINVRNIAYIESNNDSVVVNFNARISDAFVQLTLFGADAESFRKKRESFDCERPRRPDAHARSVHRHAGVVDSAVKVGSDRIKRRAGLTGNVVLLWPAGASECYWFRI